MPLRETTFIARNVETWRALETELARARPDPDRLRDLYAAASDDLSYARTHYPNRSVRSYLNHQAASLSLSLYRTEHRGADRLLRFWTDTVPLELYTQRYTLLAGFALFALSFLVGWFSSAADPAFAEKVLSAGYVAMTEDNIANGDPVAVYKDGSMLGGALGIAGNNLYVALKCFVGGVLFGLGTLLIGVSNGVMVGTFQQFFFARGVGWESALGIWTHGTIEISCIVVAVGAGLVLARGVVWPGTFTRSRAFQLSALSGLRIMAGITPLLLIAAFVEGYLTRLTDIPTALRVAFLALNVAFVAYYFVARPLQIGRQVIREDTDYGKLPADRSPALPPRRVFTAAEVFFGSVRLATQRGGKLLADATLAGALMAVAWTVGYFTQGGASETSGHYLPNPVWDDSASISAGLSPAALPLWLFTFLAVFPYLTYRLHRHLPGGVTEERRPLHTVFLLTVPWGVVAVHLLAPLLLPLTLPLLALWMRGLTYTPGGQGRTLGEALGFGFGAFGKTLGAWAFVGVTSLLALAALEELSRDIVIPFATMNVPPAWSEAYDVAGVLALLLSLVLAAALCLFWVQSFGLLYHSARERKLSEGLSEQLDTLFPA